MRDLETVRIFTGFDRREAVGWHVFCQSVIEKSSLPVEIIPITEQFSRIAGGQRDGTNAFTYGRFLIPYLSGWNGWALFVDGVDMLCRADIAELWALRDHYKDVLVVQHDYDTQHDLKYIGTKMEAKNRSYPRKNWSSVILWNCSNSPNRYLQPKTVLDSEGSSLHSFSWLKPERIGSIPKEWNWLVSEYDYNPWAKMAHFTLGIPGFAYYTNCDYAKEWTECLMRSSEGLQALRGNHASHQGLKQKGNL